MSEFESGHIIDGRYRVLHRLGAGGMADVYLAKDQQLDREVALKLLHRRFAEDPGFVERFRREAQAAASLQHPNVVSVFDRGSVEGTYYIAMEYLEGRTLKRLIREEAPLETNRAIDLTLQMLKAARFAHRRGVIHRDLKPHNVIVDDNDHVKVTDFGIARAGASDMTETGSIMGTAQYLSPEQAQGHAVSAPSDLYSIGIVLYEMLTGRVPFDGESPVSIALKHVSESPVPPSQINPDIPSALEQVVMWALNKDPADRPADADQFIMALEQVREALAAPAGETTASMRAISAGGALIPAAGYPHTSVIPASEAAGAYHGAVGVAYNGDRIDRYDDDDRRDRRGGSPVWPWLVALLVLLLIGGGVAVFLLTRTKKVLVPTVVYLQLSQAQSDIQNAGLTPSPFPATSNKPVDQVIAQSPLGHARVKDGSTVTLTYSTGPAKTTVPTVAGDTVPVATAQLRQNGVKVLKVQDQPSTSVQQGQVIGTNPPAGESVASGTRVVLVVSSGVSVPNVVNDSYGDAQAALSNFTNAGTQVTPRYQTTTTVQPDTVISQSPLAGQPLPKGGSIVLTVAKAPTTQKVPRVVGEPPTTAANELGGLGLNVSEIPKTTHNPAMVGLIVKQYPTSNMVVKKGRIISIYYGVAPASDSGGGNSGGNGISGTPTTTTTTSPSSTTTTTSVTTT
ncbi:MAG TPA: Stk1 family PASTA domain-containing Ser/Thr kinase [Solirubrobacteraceae bacterium]|jgi:serine/threonine-protein kinase|nr:Stk1 family PASTA domain-containing Ser/Thr kinase [Solirubrobacteraceae bacterium]